MRKLKSGKFATRALLTVIVVALLAVVLVACKDALETHTIRYNLPNGTTEMIEVTAGNSYSIAVPQREGYTFKGLFDQESGGIQYVSSNGLSVTNWNENADRNLFAQWESKSIQFVFDSNGGTGADNTMTIAYDATIGTFPVFTKVGHQFVGWFDGNGDNAIAYSNNMGIPTKPKMTYANYPTAREGDTVRLYAKWEANLIAVKFNTHRSVIHGSLDSTTAEEIVEIPYGSKIDAYIPTGSGFAKAIDTETHGAWGIVGWSKSKNQSGATLFNEVITEAVDLFAVWSPAIIFDMGSDEPIDAIIVGAGKEISLPTPSKNGYTFLGWKDASGKPFNEKTMPTEGKKITPVWELQVYAISYNFNGGMEINDAPVEYTVEVPKFALPIPTKEHYQFDGWYKNADFSGSAVTQLGRGINICGDLELYAKWTPIQYSIIYHKDGGELVGASTEYTIETPKFTLPIPIKEHYEFAGWYRNADFSGNAIEQLGKGISIFESVELYAKWNLIHYSLTYHSGGVVLVEAPMEYTAETSEFALPIPQKEHYEFAGWYRNAEFSGYAVEQLGKGINIFGNLELYAKWTPIVYSITYNLEGGELVGAPIKYTVETSKFILPTPKKAYFVFEGWYDNQSILFGKKVTELGSGVDIGKNLVLYAQWKQQYEGYTYIYTKEDMLKIQDNLSGKYMLIQDVDLGEWAPIGSRSWVAGSVAQNPFTGTFDGQNFRISYKLTIGKYQVGNGEDCAWGLFGACSGATLCNMNVKAEIYGDEKGGDKSREPSAGGIVGYAIGCTFENCSVSGSIVQSNNGGAGYGWVRSGGIVGYVFSSTLKNCVNYAKVYAENFNAMAGGIAGEARTSGDTMSTFTNCENHGQVSSSHGAWIFGNNRQGNIFASR